MKLKFLPVILFFACSVQFAQVQTLWSKTSGAGSMPSWFTTTNTERGFCYGNNGKLYVVSRNAGIFVKILNAETGEDIGALNTTGIAGGTFALNDVESTSEGIIYGINLSNSLADPVKIYKWASDTSAPVVVFEEAFSADKRIGDNMTIVGNYFDNSFSLWIADARGNLVYTLKKAETSEALNVVRTVTLPAGTLGSAPSVYPLLEDSMFVTKSAGRYIQAFDYNGILIDQVPGTIAGTGSTATKLFDLGRTGFIATFQYVSADLRILDTEGGEIGGANFRTYAITPALGTNANANGTGDIAIKFNTDTTVTLFHLGTNNGIAAYKISLPMKVNGRFHEMYKRFADVQNQNTGFGGNTKLKNLSYTIANDKLYLAMSTKLDKTSDQGVILFLGLKDHTGHGAAVGTALGGVAGLTGALGNTTNGNFKNDFETHYALYLSPLLTDSSVFVDMVKYTGTTKTGVVLGRCKQDGSAAFGPEAQGFFTANSVAFAFDTAFSERRGFEISIPLVELGITNFSGLQGFAAFVANDAKFSDMTLPGNVTGGNLQANPNFAAIPGGPYHATVSLSTPVELISFQYIPNDNGVMLNWSTASETNNQFFSLYRNYNGSSFEKVAVVQGAGNKATKSSYSYSDGIAKTGQYTYRLYQTDFDGSTVLISEIKVELSNQPSLFALEQNYPNPFNPETRISYNLANADNVKLVILNVLGQQVSILVNEKQDAGAHQIIFNASGLASGIYYYKIESGSFSSVKKMIVLK